MVWNNASDVDRLDAFASDQLISPLSSAARDLMHDLSIMDVAEYITPGFNIKLNENLRTAGFSEEVIKFSLGEFYQEGR